ncbi:MAG: HAMP domain-containing histidine kinase [Lachnospiraceae bacterium]|nr:HAMP domain-containing histidine kinase [Lachnospiraceae bacterium]
MEYIVICILSAVSILLAVKQIIIKRQIKSISNQLKDMTNRLITIELSDYDLSNMVSGINLLIDYMHKLKTDEVKKTDSLKLSVADISHDMRTPLTSVIGYLQLAKEECHDENVMTNINVALEKAYYCCSLINDFFDISLMDSNAYTPVYEKTDISGLLCEQILAGHPVFKEKNITPYFENADKPVFVYTDKNMLTRIIQNLISNSIKYTSGDINFTVSNEKDIILTVSNPTNQVYIDTEHIFDRYYRQHKSGNTEGSGLGLYICKKLTESIGGRIEADFADGNLSIIVTLSASL